MNIKKLFLAVAVLFAVTVSSQEKGDFNGFGGLTYPLESGADLGLTVGVEYVFAENFSAAPSFTYYTTSDVTNTQFDVDVRYYLGNQNFNWFLTAGLVSNTVSASESNITISVSQTGFNAGAGALFDLSDSISLLSTIKYNSNFEVFIPTVGVSFGF